MRNRVAAGRGLALAGALAVVMAGLTVVGPAAPATAASYAGPCVGDDARTGVTFVVDFQELAPAADQVVRCSPATLDADGDPRPRTGLQAMKDAGITPTGVVRWGEAFVCRINGRPTASEAIPVAGQPGYRERCIDTPPAAAYWSYWHADGTGEDWQYSNYGVLNRNVIPGGFEGWSFSLNATAETNPKPRHDPVNDAVDPDAPRVSLVLESPITQPVPEGSPITIAWSSSNATTLAASGDWSGSLAAGNGRRTLTPPGPGTYRYEVTASGDGGEPVTDRLTVTVSGDGGPGPGPDPDPDPDPDDPGPGTPDPGPGVGVDPLARKVAGWLVGELDRDAMPAPMPTADQPTDWGLTIDTVWALYAAGTGESTVRRVATQVERNAGDYMGIELFGDTGARRAGQTAKLLVAAVVTGRDPRSYGRVMRADGTLTAGRYDMRRETLSLIAPSGDQVGRIRDRGLGIDNTNVFSQSLAVIGLARSGGVPEIAVDYLLRQQCAAGYFRMFDRNDRTCQQDGDASDGDGTAMGLQALMTAREAGVTGLDDDIARGVAWLLRAQRPDGSFGGGVSTENSNTNSTGLIAQTLAEAGRTKAFTRARAYVRSLTVDGPAARDGLRGETGAIAYNRDSLTAARTSGISGRDQWRRATAQAVFALAPVSFVDLGKRPPAGEPEVDDDPTVDDDGTSSTSADDGETGPGSPGPSPGTDDESLGTVPGDTKAARGSDTPHGRLAAYLVRRLVDGDHVEVRDAGTTFVDYDLTADVLLALRQTGEQERASRAVTRFLLDRRSIAAYATGAPYDGPEAAYAEPLAKLILVALTSERPGDARVAQELADRLAVLADDKGFGDRGRYADESGSQERLAWTVLAATATDRADDAGPAVAALVDGACDDGTFPATPSSACATGDLEVTSLVVQALDAVRLPDASGPATAGLSQVPSSWSDDRVQALVAAGEALHARVGLTGELLDAADRRTVSLASVTTGRAALGLDGGRSASVLARAQHRDGGLPVLLPGGGDRPRRPSAADLATSARSASALAGTSWLDPSVSPLAAQVQLPLDLPVDAVPAASPEAAAPAERDWLPWVCAGLAAALLAFSLGRLSRRPVPSSRPTSPKGPRP